MSTDLTPSLARATEVLRVDGAHRRGIPVPHVATWEQKEDARAAVSAALRDPDGALARTLCRRIHRSLWPIASAPDPDQPGCANCREHVSVLRATILGEA